MMVLLGIPTIIIKHFKDWSDIYMYEGIIDQLKQKGVEFAIGLSDEELCWIEHKYEITFPKDLRSFYKEALPISRGFYNWRDKCNENVLSIKNAMKMPVKGIVENSDEIDWSEEWGEEPSNFNERKKIIENMVLEAPKLIPIFSHRYMASISSESLPIFSIYGTDIICFAKNISDYFLVEFKIKQNSIFMNNEVSYIPFWSDLL